LGISGTEFYVSDALPVIQPTVIKHRRFINHLQATNTKLNVRYGR